MTRKKIPAIFSFMPLCVVCHDHPGAARRDGRCWRCRDTRFPSQCSCGNASRKNSDQCRACQHRFDREEKRYLRCQRRFELGAQAKLKRHLAEVCAAPSHIRVNMMCVHEFIARHSHGTVHEGKHDVHVSLSNLHHAVNRGETCGTEFAVGDYCLVCRERLERLPKQERDWYYTHGRGPFVR